MISESDASFYTRREAEERLASKEAEDPMIAEIHFAMAERYADRLWSIQEKLGGNAEMLAPRR